ncbi:alpha-E domain-containing protein [Leptospirillum ferrooxidans]|uniref:DUF403 domain-containing protein n=1 Tax=Leptospirillum ferrooxidans (strain C2-3) TaxID=1162668 RepID=I0INR9_LEPFC|nr:alpha-E domain-containing protein [Leptospirillum ferrooxidans]BAM06918.1 hypothetical protein LFE_1233 [Leptospirillum ferrooxidans C2-3]
MLSRTASNVYWMARYMERAQNTARVLNIMYIMSLIPHEKNPDFTEWNAPLNITDTRESFLSRYKSVTPRNVLLFMGFDQDNPVSIYASLRRARENARGVRGTITSEMWESINDTWLDYQSFQAKAKNEADLRPIFDWVKQRAHLFNGITHGTILQDESFHFIQLGTSIERADSTARIVDVKYHILLPDPKDIGGAADYYQWGALLRSLSAFTAFRKIYQQSITPMKVAEFLLLREDLPRSLHACLDQVVGTLSMIGGRSGGEVRRIAGEIHARLHFSRIEDIFKVGLHEYIDDFLKRIEALSNEIQQVYFSPEAHSGPTMQGRFQ